MDKLRVLVLGAGFFGKNWLRELAGCAECEVAGVVAKHPDLLASVGDEFGIPASRRFATVEDGLHGSKADAVVVALPLMFHTEAIVQALSFGLHVLTEKPLAMTMGEAAEIVRAARERPNSVVMVDQNYRWRPQTQTLRTAVREGRIGPVAAIAYEYRQAITRPTTDGWRERMPHPYLLDMVVHHFDLLRAVTGLDCREVTAVGVRPPWNWYEGLPGVDALLTLDGGARATYTGSMVARGYATPQDGIVTLVGDGGTLRLEADSQVRRYPTAGGVEAVPAARMPNADTAYALREFLAAIREGRRPETHLEDNLRSLAMVHAAIASVETGQPVAVGPLVDAALGQ
jgi:predicted dehydrogenase